MSNNASKTTISSFHVSSNGSKGIRYGEDPSSDFFKMRINELHNEGFGEKTEDFRCKENTGHQARNMSTSTSTSTSTVIKDGKKITTKTVKTTGPDGKTKTETFVKEEDIGRNHGILNNMLQLEKVDLKDNTEENGSDAVENDTDVSDADSDDEFSKFQQQSLKCHNRFRAKHGVPPLGLSKKMCDYAQEWADKLLADNSFSHRVGQKFGENLFSSWSSVEPRKVKGDEAVEAWYQEEQEYNYDGNQMRGQSNTGHFTQVVWKASKMLGVGVATHGGRVIVVANYDPPGNFIGRYHENVPPPL